MANWFAGAFGGLPAGFWWVWANTLVNRTAGFVLPLFAFYLTGPLHHTAAFAGLVSAAFGVGAAFAAMLSGVAADRWGRKATLISAQLLNGIAMIALGYARSAPALIACMAAVGLFNGATRPPIVALIADLVPVADRPRAFSMNYWAINLGVSVSMASVGLVTLLGYRALFLIDGGSTLVAAIIVLLKVPDTTADARAEARIRQQAADKAHTVTQPDAKQGGISVVFRDRLYIALVAAMFFTIFVYCQNSAGFAMAMARDGMTAGQVGLVSAMNGVLIVLLQIPLTRWLGRYPVGLVLAGSSLLIGAGFGLLAFGHSVWCFALSTVVWSLGEIGALPTMQAVNARIPPADQRGRYAGVYQFAWTLGNITAPLVGGAVLGSFGGPTLWLGCFGVTALSAAAQARISTRVERRLALEAELHALTATQGAVEEAPDDATGSALATGTVGVAEDGVVGAEVDVSVGGMAVAAEVGA